MIGTGPIIKTRDEFKAYIRRGLGAPVVNTEIHDSQLEDAINEAVAEFCTRSDDGQEKRYRVLDLTTGVHEYTLEFPVYAVLGLYQSDYLDYTPQGSDLFSLNQYIANDLMTGGLGRVDILSLELVQQQIATLEIYFGKRIEFNYNAVSKVLYIHDDPTVDISYQGFSGGNTCFLMMEYYKSYGYDPAIQNDNIYDVKWVQQYSVALARHQYGINMMKWEGTTLPNGMVVNASWMITMAEDEQTRLMEQLQEEWQEPVDFFIG